MKTAKAKKLKRQIAVVVVANFQNYTHTDTYTDSHTHIQTPTETQRVSQMCNKIEFHSRVAAASMQSPRPAAG